MTLSTEWSQVESSIQAIAPPSSGDLFDGDIFGQLEGDELMDIYNAAVVGSGEGDEAMNDIPSLLISGELPGGEKKVEAIDDGFGAFRPSTSFNDLSTYLHQANSATSVITSSTASSNNVVDDVNESATTASSEALPPVVSSTSPLDQVIPAPQTIVTSDTNVVASSGGTKRKTQHVSTGPASKRRGTSAGRKNSGGVSGSKQKGSTSKGIPSGSKTISKKKNANNTPNPLASLPYKANNNTVAPTVTTTLAPANCVVPQNTSVVSSNANTGNEIKTSTAITSKSAVAPPVASAGTSRKKTSIAPPKVTASSDSPTQVSSHLPTEADFKYVAQAAVNNLIMSVGNNKNNAVKSSAKSKGSSKSSLSQISSSSITKPRVNTSTEHVKALTGSNWVAVCGGGNGTGGDANDGSNQSNNDKNRARRSNLTPDERARQNRDRNREHARNTRLRKKAYVEELKATLSAMVAQRDSADLERRHASQRELEQREVRFRVIEEFLKLRGRNEANPARWFAILQDKFSLTIPVTHFREMVHSNDSSHCNANALHEQVLTGVTEVMNDSALFSAFLQGLGNKNSDIITLSYNCNRNHFFMDNCTAFLDWAASTNSADEQRSELIVKGNIRAKFSPDSNKLISVVMSFDTSAIMSQVNLTAQVKESSEVDAAAAAAQVAANEAHALLDSIKMPHLEPSTKINVVPPSESSASSDEKAALSSDDDKDEVEDDTKQTYMF